MNRAVKIFLIVIIVAVIAAAAAWAWFVYMPSAPITNEPAANVPITNAEPVTNMPTDNTPVVTNAEQQLKSVARLFTTAYGSYSTDARWQNLKELTYLYTPTFEAYINQYLSQNQSPDGYYSVNTRALASKVVTYSDTQAIVVVETQREEVFSLGGVAQLSYQSLELQFIKLDGQWKVDSAVWQ